MEMIKDKVVVITGASSGLGAAAARRLVDAGAKVVLAARREAQLKGLAATLGDNSRYVVTDVTKKNDHDRLVKSALDAFGQIDAFWNNAGDMPLSFFEEQRVEEWDRMIEVNIKGVLYGINAVLPYMLKRGVGHILATSSVAGLRTTPGLGVYSATKYAVRAIMDTLRQEVADTIKVTTIYPGAVESNLGHDITSSKIKATLADFATLRKMQGDVIADAVIYAISQPAIVNVNEIVLRPLGQKM